MMRAKVPASLRLPSGGPSMIKRAAPGAAVAAATLFAGANALAGVEIAAVGAAGEVEQVTVTETRRAANPHADPVAPYKVDQSASSKIPGPLLDFAKSLTVIPKEAIRDSGATTFRDLMRAQPGVTLGTGEGGNAFGDRVFVRGFDARNDVYVDGIRDPGVGSREIFAVEQVEIMKGPSSALGGRGTTGGAISLVTKAPAAGNFGDAEAAFGTDDTRRLTLDVNREVTDRLTVRVNGLYHESGVAGRDHVFNDRWGLALAATYAVTDRVRISADYYHLTTDEMPDWGVPYDTASNRPFHVPRGTFYGVLARDFRRTFADIYTVKGVWDVNAALSLQSVTRYGVTGNAYIASAPESPVTTGADPSTWTVRANPKQRDAVNDYVANQTDATWRFETGGLRHVAVTGVEITREGIRNRQYQNLNAEVLGTVVSPTTIIQNLWRPDPYAAWPFPKSLQSLRDATVDTKAAYALDTVTLSERWQALGAVRFDDYRLKVDTLTLATGVHAPLNNAVTFWNWQAGLVFKPAPNGSLYASLGSSSNPSGEQIDATGADYGGLTTTNANLEPERNKAYEIGAKWNALGGHLALSSALFRIEKENARVTIGSGATATIQLAGTQRADGIEFGAAGNITEMWSVLGGLTFLDARTVKSPVASQVGAKFPNVAKTSFSLMNKLRVTDALDLGGTATYDSRRWGGTTTATITFIPSFWRFDVFANYKITDALELSVTALNLTDKLYYDALYRSATPFSYVAPGRSVLVKLDYEF